MTTISTLVGFTPLVLATGAGAASRWSLGTTVFGGLLVATFLSLLLAPILYIVIKNWAEFIFSGKLPSSLPPPTPSSSSEIKPLTKS